ncbi:MAG: cation:dicarboxylase symporter family transporter [Bacteroidetes bacterium]|jgi:proton glutamate symport protein|nr:cation:dicarboxylase symporter family transporter [Bacteroidota bacterium]
MTPDAKPVRRWWHLSLMQQIILGLAVGVLVGWLWPDIGTESAWIRTIFINLIKVIIAPLIFSSIVAGIAGGGEFKQVGRMGVKALVYFEVVTTLALVIGLVVVNITKPGVGVLLQGGDPNALGSIRGARPMTFIETIVHAFPSSIIDSMARGDVLQIVVFSVFFGAAVGAIGEKGRLVLEWCDALSQVMFKFTAYVMKFAPFGIGAAMAVTIGHMGLGVLVNLGMLVLTLYVALIIFVVLVLGAVAWIIRLPVRQFVKAVWEPFTLAFWTTSSESALPMAMERMERLGVPKRIVGFVLPTGYSFNLDGSTLYLAVASVFVAQAAEMTTGVHFGWDQQILLMLTLMVTSKGVAAVPRASLVILLAALHSFGLPPEGVAVIFAVDEFMDMGRTSVNVLGNCLATVAIARWEGKFDDDRARVYGTPAEAQYDLQAGEPAFAQSVADQA